MRLLLLILCCWQAAASVQNDGFYFPDQLPAKSDAQSQAWTDGKGNSQATANAAASVGGTNPPPVDKYPPRQPVHEPIGGGHEQLGGHGFGGGFNQYQPPREPAPVIPSGGHGHDFGGGFNQGYPTGPINPPHQIQPYPSFNQGSGQSNAQANAQSNTQGGAFGSPQSSSTSNAQASSQKYDNGNVISNAVSNTLTNGPNGEASASSAAGAAGVVFVNGIPVATASAAASVASTAPGAGTVSSSSHSNGPQQSGPNFNYGPNNNYQEPFHPRPPPYGRAPYNNGPNLGPYNRPNMGPYNGPKNIYGEQPYQQAWFYRSGWDKNDDNATDTEVVEGDSKFLESDRISKSSELDNVTFSTTPKSKGDIIIFKD